MTTKRTKRTKRQTTRWQTLPELAEEANEYLEKVRTSLRRSIYDAHGVGSALIKAKAFLKYLKNRGRKVPTFGDWLEKNFKGSRETAVVYMRLARNWDNIANKVQSTSLTIAQALDMLRGENKNEKAKHKKEKDATEQKLTEENELSMMRSNLAATFNREFIKRLSFPELEHFTFGIEGSRALTQVLDDLKKASRKRFSPGIRPRT